MTVAYTYENDRLLPTAPKDNLHHADGIVASTSNEKAIATSTTKGLDTPTSSYQNTKPPIQPANRAQGRWLFRLAAFFAIALMLALARVAVLLPTYRTNDTGNSNTSNNISNRPNGKDDVKRKYYPPYYNEVVDALHRLDSNLEGSIYMFDQSGFDSAATVWNRVANDHPPLAVIQVQNERDVQLALLVIRQMNELYRVPFRIRSGGHHKAGYSSVPNGIVLSLVRMNQIEFYGMINQNSQNDKNVMTPTATRNNGLVVAKFGPGVLSQDVINKVLTVHGYAGVIGICGTVAESGYVLGGGHGFQSRERGLGLDQVVGMRIVLANGTVLDLGSTDIGDEYYGVDERDMNNHTMSTSHSDLFWALRGAGGGNFGVVTQLRYRLYPTQDTQWLTIVNVSRYDLPPLLQRVGDLNHNGRLPGELLIFVGASKLRLVFFGWFSLDANPSGRAPENFKSTLFDLFNQTKHKTAASATAPITSETQQDWQILPFSWSGTVQPDSPYSQPSNQYVQAWNGFLFTENNTLAVWTEILNQITSILEECSYLSPHIELWGGAISNVAPNATAFFYRQALFNVGVQLSVPASVDDEAGWSDGEHQGWRTFHEQVTKVNAWWPNVNQFLNGAYVNYALPSLNDRDYARTYWGNNLERLVRVKQKYDPTNLFQFEQSVPMVLS